MDYYYHEFSELQEEFHKVMHDYPLFIETVQDIEEKNIKEINELLEKDDEYYLKKAISKLKDLIEYIKKTSVSIQKEYEEFDKLARIWEKTELHDIDDIKLKEINNNVKKANLLIGKHSINDLREANKIMNELVKNNK